MLVVPCKQINHCYGVLWFLLYLSVLLVCAVVLFFKQKTAYEMRISDWSSDVCSSDLRYPHRASALEELGGIRHRRRPRDRYRDHGVRQIGRASCRERVCQYV